MRFRLDYHPERPDAEQDTPEDTRRNAPWDRQAHEPDHAWDLFARFLTAPERSVAAFCASRALSAPSVQSIAAKWRWRARRAALEGFLHDATIASAEDAARERGRLHADFLADALEWARESMQAQRAAAELLDPAEALRFAKMAIEFQRLIDGEPGARTAITFMDNATPAQVDALEAALVGLEAGAKLET